MLHIVQGLTNPKMKPVKTELSDFEALIRFKTIQIKPEQKNQMVSMRNGTTETLAKATLCWYFIAGELLNEKRSNANLVNRSLLILDYDDVKTDIQNAKKIIHDAISEYAYFLYPSTSYTQEKPKFRLVVDAERNMNKGEYQATIKTIGELIGLPYDDVSHATWSQLMGCPITDDISEFDSIKVINEGEVFPVLQGVVEEPERAESFTLSYPTRYGDGKGKTIQLLEEVVHGICEPGRNSFFTRAFGILLKANMDIEAAINLMIDWNDRYVQPPLGQSELHSVLKSIVSREKQKERSD
jgi:hypothetical protein